MKNPNRPDEFPGQIRKAFVGTEPSKAPTKKGVDKTPAPKPRITHG